MPHPGEIVHASRTFEEPAGGGAVAAVQLRKLAGEAALFTAFGDDETGHRSEAELREHGAASGGPLPPRAAAARLHPPRPRGERTITVLGPRLGPSGAADLPWELLDDTDAVYLTAGDVEAVRQARRARTLVATPRGLDTLADAHVELDALVMSGRDPGERYSPGDLDPAPRLVVRTAGASRRRVGDRGRRARPLGADAAARAGARRLRGRRQLRRRPHLRARSRLERGQGGRACGPLRRRLPHRSRAVRGPARSSDQATWPSAGSIGRPSLDPRLQPAVEVVRLEAGGGERLRGERRPAPRTAVEDDRPLAVELLRPARSARPARCAASRRCGPRRARTARARRPPARRREAAPPRAAGGEVLGSVGHWKARLLALG